MGQYHVEVSRVIAARPQEIYAVLADYRTTHPNILPSQYFKELTIEEGGVGAGTVFRLRMSVMGASREYRMIVSEPEPGRVMVETDSEAGVVTTFTVDPLANGAQSRVSISLTGQTSPGLMGMLEKRLNPLVLRRVFAQELELLDEYVRTRQPSP